MSREHDSGQGDCGKLSPEAAAEVTIKALRAEVEKLQAEVLRLNRVLVRESSGISREFSPELLGR